jgi:hypothetical protein
MHETGIAEAGWLATWIMMRGAITIAGTAEVDRPIGTTKAMRAIGEGQDGMEATTTVEDGAVGGSAAVATTMMISART